MKIDLILPGGGEFHLEKKPKEPMDDGRFQALCGLLYALIAAGTLIGVIIVIKA